MNYLQGYARARLNAAMIRSRRRVFGDIFSHVTRLLTATGWYAVAAMATDKGWHISVWNPATVFPEYSDSGELLKVARIYTLSRQAAYKKIYEQGWMPIKIVRSAVKIKQLWFWSFGTIFHAVVIGNTVVQASLPPLLSLRFLCTWLLLAVFLMMGVSVKQMTGDLKSGKVSSVQLKRFRIILTG